MRGKLLLVPAEDLSPRHVALHGFWLLRSRAHGQERRTPDEEHYREGGDELKVLSLHQGGARTD